MFSDTDLTDTIKILVIKQHARRERAKTEVRRILDRYQLDQEVDALTLPERRYRKKRLADVQKYAALLRRDLKLIAPPDQLRLELRFGEALRRHHLTNLYAAMQTYRTVDLSEFPDREPTLLVLLDCIAEAAECAANDIPRARGGRTPAIADRNLAMLCLRMFVEYRPGEKFIRSKFDEFLRAVYDLVSEDWANLKRPADNAVEAWRSKSGIFGAGAQNKT